MRTGLWNRCNVMMLVTLTCEPACAYFCRLDAQNRPVLCCTLLSPLLTNMTSIIGLPCASTFTIQQLRMLKPHLLSMPIRSMLLHFLKAFSSLQVLIAQCDAHDLFRNVQEVRGVVVLLRTGSNVPTPHQLAVSLRNKQSFEND